MGSGTVPTPDQLRALGVYFFFLLACFLAIFMLLYESLSNLLFVYCFFMPYHLLTRLATADGVVVLLTGKQG